MSGIYLSSHSVASLSLQYLGNSSKLQTFQRNSFIKHLYFKFKNFSCKDIALDLINWILSMNSSLELSNYLKSDMNIRIT